MQNESNPAIYVACLAAYNNGKLHGRWIDATQEVEDIKAQVQDMLAKSPEPDAEEWAIHDYSGFGSIVVSEAASFEKLRNLALFAVEHGELGEALLSEFSGCLEGAENALENHYYGAWASEQDYAEHLFDDIYLHQIPEHLHYYIDYKAFCHDLFIQDYFSIEANGQTHVFENI